MTQDESKYIDTEEVARTFLLDIGYNPPFGERGELFDKAVYKLVELLEYSIQAGKDGNVRSVIENK
jgi:hypothetical protein